MRQRQSSVTMETQLPVTSSGAACLPVRGACGGGAPNWANMLAGARASTVIAAPSIRSFRIIVVSSLFCDACAQAPSGAIGDLLEVRAGHERFGQILGIL